MLNTFFVQSTLTPLKNIVCKQEEEYIIVEESTLIEKVCSDISLLKYNN